MGQRGVVDGGLELTRYLALAQRWLRPAAATGGIVAGLFGIAALLTPGALAQAGTPSGPGTTALSWWLLALLFGLGDLLEVGIEIRGEAQCFTFSETPLMLALLFAGPRDLLVARVLGGALALVLVERQPPVKVTFNLTLFWAEGCVALWVFRLAGGAHGGLSGRGWLVALLAVMVAGALGSVAVWAVVRSRGGEAVFRHALVGSGVTALGNACLGGVAAVLIAGERWALVPFATVVIAVVVAYRRYDRLSRRYAGLEALYTFTRATGEALTYQQVVSRVLESARDLLHARVAVATLAPPSGRGPVTRVSLPASAAPEGVPPQLWRRVAEERRPVILAADTDDPELRGVLDALGLRNGIAAPLLVHDDVVGALLLGDRFRGSFGADDTRVLTALMAQARVAVDKGRLLQQVHDQAMAREHEALHDALTGLPNRVLFARELDRALSQARQDGSRTAVLLMDLNQFKEVNDALGHHTGDLLLREVAARLLDVVGARGTVARLGGDEFAVLVPRLASDEDAVRMAHLLHARMTEPVRLAEMRIEVGVSIGVAIRPDHGDDDETLLRRADVAMYASKRARERVVFYDPATDWNSPARVSLAADLRAALTGTGLTVCYQPIAGVGDLEVASVEALIRWEHPELGALSPDEFIPVAERTGLIGPLTRFVVRRCLQDSATWRAAGLDVHVAVNLSVHTLVDSEWPGSVLALLHEQGVPADRLSFEITESGIMADPERVIPVLRDLVARGVRFSVDDFGTGHSSLAYLQRLPISEVKIDKSFVRPMTTDPGAESIVRSVVDLARSLGLDTVAEGVEDAATLDRLRQIRCHRIQGFLVAQPMPGDQVAEWLATPRTRPGGACAAGPGLTPAPRVEPDGDPVRPTGVT